MSKHIDRTDQPCPTCNGAGKTDIVKPNRREVESACLALIDTFRSNEPAGVALAQALIKQGWQAPI